ncbi:HIT family protein [Aquabacterium sp.]|uniref:HIT family protein n=1 Tax=Aquabacterium sp. TaxID=1872578 RepID=UPI003D6CFC64
MAYNDQNIFAKILRGEIPCIKLYEDEHTLSFMDIMPQADGHALVIPKEAAETLLELSDDSAAACIKTAKKVAAAVKKAMDAPGIVVFQLNGAAAGQTVPHYHVHVLPSSLGALGKGHASKMEDQAKLQAIAEKIRAAF